MSRPPFKVTTREKEQQRHATARIREAIVRLIDGGVTPADEQLVQMLVSRYVYATEEVWLERALMRFLLRPDAATHGDRIMLGTTLLNVAFMLDPREAPALVGMAMTAAHHADAIPPGVNPGPRRRRAPAGNPWRR